MAMLARLDPGNENAVGYMWGTTGSGYDAERVATLAPGVPADGWSLLYDPRVAAKLAPCGISIVDAPGEAVGSLLIYLGF